MTRWGHSLTEEEVAAIRSVCNVCGMIDSVKDCPWLLSVWTSKPDGPSPKTYRWLKKFLACRIHGKHDMTYGWENVS